MVETDKFLVTNIRQYLNSDNPKLGEDKLIQELSEFSCPRNSDIEHFLKNSAIEFAKKNQSVTYLVFSLGSMALVGYFTIALKPLTVRGEKVSNTIKRKIMCDLEANDEESLLSFYQDNKFRQFDTRLTASNATNQHELVQLLRLL